MSDFIKRNIKYKRFYLKRIHWLFSIVLCICYLTVLPQDKKQLENKKKQIQQEIEKTDKLLNETTKDKQISLGHLVIINKRIEDRERLINTINAEIRLINKKIASNQGQIASLQMELKKLKDDYAKMIVHAYRNKSGYTNLMFVFASEDFNQAYRRLKYYQQYSAFRKRQAEIIKQTNLMLDEKINELKEVRKEKELLMMSEKEEKNNLSKEKVNQQQTVKVLQTKEKQLKDDLKKKQKEAASLQKAIEEAIRKEIELSKKKGSFELTPEAAELMGRFEKNMGKLPWPVEKGVITDGFGVKQHPVLKTVQVNNNGIDISTTKDAIVRAVFDGVVSKVIIIPNAGKAILVRHGEYLTVYYKIKDSFVNPGDKITTKQDLGNLLTDSESGRTELHFEVWKGKTILNPTDWIYKGK